MKKILVLAGFAGLMSTSAMAQTVGVSMALFDDNFLTVLRNGLEEYAGTKEGVEVQIEDAQNDVAKQLDQINNFIASGVDAIIVNPVDTSATQAMSDAANAAGVPLVYVNREPINVDTLPDNQAFVASDERESGTLETLEVCRLLQEAGKTEASIYVMQGQLSNQAAVQRTQDIHDVIESGDCGVTLNIIDQQTANWSRDEAQNLMTNWLSTGEPFDAVISNNDEMAIGAIQALEAAGRTPGEDVFIYSIDGTRDALQSIIDGKMEVTVESSPFFGPLACDVMKRYAAGETIEPWVKVEDRIFTPENAAEHIDEAY
jgi:inositol transport system substrate-binding protein